MAKSSRPSKAQKRSQSARSSRNKSTVRNSRTTISGPAEPDTSGIGEVAADKADATQDLASAFAFNTNKAAEYDPAAALAPPQGASVKSRDPIAGASTVSERTGSAKVGSGGPNIGRNPTVGPLDRVRVDSTARALTTNQGVPLGDNQNSLKAGLRGPTLLEDFILREKITHFDHERIPERIVHARGSAAHGYFECTKALMYDALVLPDGAGAIAALRADGRTLEFIKDQYRHCKPILALGASDQLLQACGIDRTLPNGQPDPGVLASPDPKTAADDFVAAIARHRHFDREADPPRV